MKVIFITSSLEPGKDGVGDYTRILASAFIKLGHTVTALTLLDKFVTTEITGTQFIDEVELPIVRLPQSWGYKASFKRAGELIKILDPDWISIQFVIFSFNEKGLPFYLSDKFRGLTRGRYCHIMFHELWVGIHTSTSPKLSIWGWLQKQIIKNFLLQIKPFSIHTHTRLYQQKLNQIGFAAAYLPLFGNVPLKNKSLDIDRVSNVKCIGLVFFGTLHTAVPVVDFVTELVALGEINQLQFKVAFVGRTGPAIATWTAAFKKAAVRFTIYGELATGLISEILSESAIGISTTPILFSEKSGTIAAMREHGLPVICVAQEIQLKNSEKLTPPPGVFKYSKGNFAKIFKGLKNTAGQYQVNQIAAQLAEVFLSV